MCFFLTLTSWWSIAALPASTHKGDAGIRHKPLASPSPAKHYALCCGLQATVEGRCLTITKAQGVVVAQNKQLIRLADEHATCPSEGFAQLVSKGNYFTIEQQNCSGWFFINEYITFRYVPSSGKIELHKFGLAFTDRRAPNKAIPAKVFTSKQFGQRYFGQVTLAEIEALDH